MAEVLDGNVGWHQDAAHWTMFNSTTFCTAWIALQDTPTDMCFVEGSHKWGLIKAAAGFVLEIPWQCFHTGLTFHGSGHQDGCAASLNCA